MLPIKFVYLWDCWSSFIIVSFALGIAHLLYCAHILSLSFSLCLSVFFYPSPFPCLSLSLCTFFLHDNRVFNLIMDFSSLNIGNFRRTLMVGVKFWFWYIRCDHIYAMKSGMQRNLLLMTCRFVLCFGDLQFVDPASCIAQLDWQLSIKHRRIIRIFTHINAVAPVVHLKSNVNKSTCGFVICSFICIRLLICRLWVKAQSNR